MFECQKLIPQIDVLKEVFLSGDSRILRETASRLYYSTGGIKERNVVSFGENLSELFGTKAKKYGRFSFHTTPNWSARQANFIDFNLAGAVEVRGSYENALKHLFTDVFLRRLFDVFGLLLKVQKAKDTIGKIWKKMGTIQSKLPALFVLLRMVYVVSRDFLDFLGHHFTFVVIEPLVKTLLKNLSTVATFQQTFKSLNEFQTRLFSGVFLDKDSTPTLRQVLYMGKCIVSFYKIVL